MESDFKMVNMDVPTILVIMLSAGFLVLLFLSIFLVYILIKVISSIRRMAERAEHTTENWTEFLKLFSKRVAPVALTSLIGVMIKRFASRSKR